MTKSGEKLLHGVAGQSRVENIAGNEKDVGFSFCNNPPHLKQHGRELRRAVIAVEFVAKVPIACM